MAATIRTADKVAHGLTRNLPVYLGTAAPTYATEPHGVIGADDCILTVALDSTVAQTTNITCWVKSTFANQWFKAGANNGFYQKSFEASGQDVFVLPEGSTYFLQGNYAISKSLVYTDGGNFPSGTIN